MKIHKILLKRQKIGNYNNLFGILTVETNHGTFYFSTIENYEDRIKEGAYSIDYTYSPKFKRNTPEILGVKDRTGIRIHTGNRGNDFTGCIGLGLINYNKEIPTQVWYSRQAVEQFEALICNNILPLKIYITKNYENEIIREISNTLVA
jgi:hypothetical protein